MVVMLAAEDTSTDGPLASTPERSTDYVDRNPPKKLVQARLPFKRLNPEPKGTREPKRVRGPPLSSCHGNGVSDGENETNDFSPPQCPRPAIVNGRGPIDGFIIQKRRPGLPPSVPAAIVDLTEDSNSSGTVCQQQQPLPAPASDCPFTNDHILPGGQDKSFTISSQTSLSDVKENGNVHIEENDPKENAERENAQEDCAAESRQESGLLSSAASTSSLSTLDSSPESTKTTRCPSSTTELDGPSETKKVKRRSLKSLKEQEERQQQRAEKDRQRMEAKAANEKKKLEARRLKEEKEKERKEKREKEEREKREKKEKEEKEKAEKLRAKTEERKAKQEAKQEEKRKKEEEKRMKEEEKRMKEEKDRIKAEKAEITRFLQKPKAQLAPKTLASACGKFAPFEIKEHMVLAPLCRVQCENTVFEGLDQYLAKPDRSANWLKDLTSRTPRSSGQTKLKYQEPRSENLVVVKCPKTGVPGQTDRGRMKLLQFHENYRPAYWGTWSKKSTCISARHPFQQDKDLFEYEVDSDEEWEEEEPGESLSHSEGDDDGDDDDDDDDDGFFVPHGYLSDGEGALEEEEGGDPDKQKLRQKLKAREWDELLSKKRVKVLEAVISGCLWDGQMDLSQAQREMLHAHAISMLEPLPKDEPSSPENSPGEMRDELLPQLLLLLHGNVNSSKVIISEFQEFCRQQATSLVSSPQGPADSIPTRVGLKRLIKENAVYEKRSCLKRCCWYVHAEVLARFRLESLPVPCKWNYLTAGVQQCREDAQTPANSQGSSPTTPQTTTTLSVKRKSAGSMSITKFMKKCVDQEQADGFQADTEDEEDDCVYISTESGFSTKNVSSSSLQSDTQEAMEVGTSTSAPMPSPSTT